MKKLITICALVIASAAAPAHASFESGNSLASGLEKHQPWALGYIEGIADLGDGTLFCFPVGTTVRQLRIATEKAINERPTALTGSAADIVYLAFSDNWPCKKEAGK